jgi:hypothetical protein
MQRGVEGIKKKIIKNKYQQSCIISGFSFSEFGSLIDEYCFLISFRLGRDISDVRRPPIEEQTWEIPGAYSSSSRQRYSQILLVLFPMLFFSLAAFIFLWVEAMAFALE